MEDLGGDPNASPYEMDNALSLKACETLRAYTDSERERGISAGRVNGDGANDLWEYEKNISFETLISLIGMKHTKDLLDFFYESVGQGFARYSPNLPASIPF